MASLTSHNYDDLKARERKIEGCGYNLEVPADFERRLKAEFPHFRLRWSRAQGVWHLEQQVGRAALPPLWISPIDDRLIRARDGYRYVLTVTPGDRMACPECRTTIKVPHLRFSRLTCEYCLKKVMDPRTPPQSRKLTRIAAGYFPLGEALLEHLRKIDFRRDGNQRQLEALKLHEMRREWQEIRERKNHGEAVAKDGFTAMFGIQSVGYTGNSKVIHRSKF